MGKNRRVTGFLLSCAFAQLLFFKNIPAEEVRVFSSGENDYLISEDAREMVLINDADSPTAVVASEQEKNVGGEMEGDFLSYNGKIYFTSGHSTETVWCYDPETDMTEEIVDQRESVSLLGILDNTLLMLADSEYEGHKDLLFYSFDAGEVTTQIEHVVDAGIAGDTILIEINRRNVADPDTRLHKLGYTNVGDDKIHIINDSACFTFINDDNDLFFSTRQVDDDGNILDTLEIIHGTFDEDGVFSMETIGFSEAPEAKIHFLGMAGDIPYFIYYDTPDDGGCLMHAEYIDGEYVFKEHRNTAGKMDDIQIFFTDDQTYYCLDNVLYRDVPGEPADADLMYLPEDAVMAGIGHKGAYYYLDSDMYMADLPGAASENNTVENEKQDKTTISDKAQLTEELEASISEFIDRFYQHAFLLDELKALDGQSSFLSSDTKELQIHGDLSSHDGIKLMFDALFDKEKNEYSAEYGLTEGEESSSAGTFSIKDGNLTVAMEPLIPEITIPYDSLIKNMIKGGIKEKYERWSLADILQPYEVTADNGSYSQFYDETYRIIRVKISWEQMTWLLESYFDFLKDYYKAFTGDDLSEYSSAVLDVLPELKTVEGRDTVIDFFLDDGKLIHVTMKLLSDPKEICPTDRDGNLIHSMEVYCGSYINSYNPPESNLNGVTSELFISDTLPDESIREYMNIPDFDTYMNLQLSTTIRLVGEWYGIPENIWEDYLYQLRTGKTDSEDSTTVTMMIIPNGVDPDSAWCFERTVNTAGDPDYSFILSIMKQELFSFSLNESEATSDKLVYDAVMNITPDEKDKMEGTLKVSRKRD